MSETYYLRARGKRFSLRIAISRKLFPYTPKREIERAIKTNSYRLAVRVATQVHNNYKLFEVDLIYFTTSSCSSCKLVQERTAFHKDKRATDGRHTQCKTCRSNHAKATKVQRNGRRKALKKERKVLLMDVLKT